jgi:hypothetical protein
MKIDKIIENNYIETSDIAFSAWLKINGYHLLKSEKINSKRIFFFDIGYEKEGILRAKFIKSDFPSFYNELKNLNKQLCVK